MTVFFADISRATILRCLSCKVALATTVRRVAYLYASGGETVSPGQNHPARYNRYFDIISHPKT